MYSTKHWQRLNLGFIFVPKGYRILKYRKPGYSYYAWYRKNVQLSKIFGDRWSCYRNMMHHYKFGILASKLLENITNYAYETEYANKYKVINLGAIKMPEGVLILKQNGKQKFHFLFGWTLSIGFNTKWKALRMAKRAYCSIKDGKAKISHTHLIDSQVVHAYNST